MAIQNELGFHKAQPAQLKTAPASQTSEVCSWRKQGSYSLDSINSPVCDVDYADESRLEAYV